MLKGKERKKRQKKWIYKQIEVDEDLYKLNINWKGKRTIGKANKEINVETIIIGLKNKIKKREKKNKQKRKTPQNCKIPTQRQRFIATIKNVLRKT